MGDLVLAVAAVLVAATAAYLVVDLTRSRTHAPRPVRPRRPLWHLLRARADGKPGDITGPAASRGLAPAVRPPEPTPQQPQEDAASGAVATPAQTADPGVRRLVLEPPPNGWEHEPRLPDHVTVSSGWHGSFFHGWCGTATGTRPVARLGVRGATLRGATHAGLGTEGQDAVGAAWDGNRTALYLAVADGLGSLPRSGRVAVEAINAALHLCLRRPPGISFVDNGTRLFERIAAGMRRSLGAEDAPLDGACTLVIAEVLPRFDGADVTVHGIGDSEAWALYNGTWTPLHHERGGADNATRDLPAHVQPRSGSYQLPPGSVLLLGTDGFAGALDTSTSPLARCLAKSWRVRPSWVEFVNHVGFVDEYYADDRSAVAVWIGEGESLD
ncbi:protein phosphatase 2C domain-containing protein [Micromonospora sp. NPDC047644]|uniref:protein phosphatase 2C domain-containing protein n=1 Tax=Micromonospora sp. NPDC047644 TaxID=3157203 RepID=UPI003451C479